MPSMDVSAKRKLRRRLGETMVGEEDAAIACAHARPEDMDACMFDVLATNDKGVAGSY